MQSATGVIQMLWSNIQYFWVFLVKEPLSDFAKKNYGLIRLLAWPGGWLLHRVFKMTSNQVTALRFTSPFTFYLLASLGKSKWEYISAVMAYAYTDAVDGFIASEYEKKSASDSGVILDPLADKFLIASMYLFHYQNFPKLVVTTLGGEILIGSIVLGYLARNGKGVAQMKSTYWGKYKLGFEIATAILMSAYTFAPSQDLQKAILGTGIAAILCLLMSLLIKIKEIS